MASSSSVTFSNCTQEEFNLFHAIDRELYTKLVINIGREPAESMQVIAFWIWLEQSRLGFRNLVEKLRAYPETIINAVAEETVACLKCIEGDHLSISPDSAEIPLIQSLCEDIHHEIISVQYFHENRLRTIRGVAKIMNDVCFRAFNDITAQAHENKQVMLMGHPNSTPRSSLGSASRVISAEQELGVNNFLQTPMMAPPPFPHLLNYDSTRGGLLPRPNMINPIALAALAAANGEGSFPSSLIGHDHYDLPNQRKIINDELGDLFSRIHMRANEEVAQLEANEDVAPDDRTIFLTFSKGYPITREEVREFFTRRHGDIIEAIYMQDVKEGEQQVLYARLVVRHFSMIDNILGGQGKAKFAINGKHVWARKYVRKASRSPPRESSSI